MNGKLHQVYGKGASGTPIPIAYDPVKKHYTSLANKRGPSSENSCLYDAIASGTGGMYRAEDLRVIVANDIAARPGVYLDVAQSAQQLHEVGLESRMMVGGNNDPVEGLLANPIWNLMLPTVARGVVAYQESHKDSKQRNERDWQDVVKEFENEHNQYVVTLNEGDSNIFVKYGYRSMDMIGMVGRTTVEGGRDTLAMVPDARAYLNAFVSGAGYVIGEGIIEGTPRLVLEGLGNAHESYLGLFQTENQKWTADLGLGMFLPPAIGKVLQVTKTGANMLLRTAETNNLLGKVKLWDVKGAGSGDASVLKSIMADKDYAHPNHRMNMLDLTEESISSNMEELSLSKTAASAKMAVLDVPYYAKTNSWPEIMEHLKLVPEGFEIKGYTKGRDTIGVEFQHIKHHHDTITFKKAKLDAKYDSQKVDYVSYTENGNKHVGRNGDVFYEKHGEIWTKCSKTNKDTLYLF